MTNEQRIEEAARILGRGGRLVVAKNVAAAMEGAPPTTVTGAPRQALPFGVKLQVCEWLPDDTVLAIAPEADSERLALKFAARPSPSEGDAGNDNGKDGSR